MDNTNFVGTNKVPLGSKCQDKVTGFVGICIAKFYQISGCTSVRLESLTEKNEGKPVYRYLNADRVKILDKKNVYGTVVVEESILELGAKAKSDVYDIEGTITAIAFYPDNCPHGEIQPAYHTGEGKLPDAHSIAEHLIEITTAAVPMKYAVPTGKQSSPPHAPTS